MDRLRLKRVLETKMEPPPIILYRSVWSPIEWSLINFLKELISDKMVSINDLGMSGDSVKNPSTFLLKYATIWNSLSFRNFELICYGSYVNWTKERGVR